MIVPLGFRPPASVAVSVTVPPATTPGDAWVVSVGTTPATTTDSPGSLQAPATAALFASPEYEAIHR